MLARAPGALPTRRCSLIEVEGTLAHFAGSGWDAMILDDYKRQLDASTGAGRHFSKSMYGYLSAALLRTAPRVGLLGNPHVVIENLGSEVYGVDPDGKPGLLEGVGRGAVIYDGTVGIASVGTCPEFGYRFRAFPFAERMPGFMSVRAYAAERLRRRGDHPAPVERRAPAARDARLARDERAHDLLAIGSAPDRRRRTWDAANHRVQISGPERRHGRLAPDGVTSTSLS